MNSSLEVITWNGDSGSEVTALKVTRLPYLEIKSIDHNDRIGNADFRLPSELRSLMLPKLENSLADLQNVKKSRLAFECATALTNDMSYEFYMAYYNEVIAPVLTTLNENSLHYDSLKKLNEYMFKGKLADTNAMLRTVALCLTESTIDLKILDEFPSTTWRREMLLNALLANNHSWDLTLVQRIIEKIDNTIDSVRQQNRSLNIENVLEFLLTNQRFHHFQIEFLMDILDFISREDNDDVVKYITNIPIMTRNKEGEIQAATLELSDLQNIIHASKVNIVSKYCQDIGTNECDQLLNVLIDCSLDTIEYFVCLIRDIGNIEILKVIKLLNVLKLTTIPSNEVERFLYNLTTYNSAVWRYKFLAFIIQKMILNEFPSYEALINGEKGMDIKGKQVNESSWLSLSGVCHYAKSYLPGNSGNSGNSHTTYEEFNREDKSKLQNSPQLCRLLRNLHETLITFMLKTSDESWSETLSIIKILVRNLDSEGKIEEFRKSLEILKDYNVSIVDHELLQIYWDSNVEEIEHRVHDFVIQSVFPGTHEKERDELIEELEKFNQNIDIPSIVELLDDIDLFYKESIYKWSFDDINMWTPKHGKSAKQVELLAVIKRAVYLTKKIEVRDIQMISLILMLNHNENTGRLGQINTGEGKTLVIAMLAAYLALKGHKVDIITSSAVLAIPQSREFEYFYSLLNLSVDHNINNPQAYNSDIVYGINLNYQGDILQSEFKKTRGRDGRIFDIAIVDEVDNMLIDGNKNVVLLSAPMPGMDQLEPLLGLVSLSVDAFASTLKEKDGELFVCEPASNTDGKDDGINLEVPIFGTKEDYITKNVEKEMKAYLRDEDRHKNLDATIPEIKIPNHLREFVLKVQLKNWIRTAMEAKFGLENDQQYIIRNGTINIVDAHNTGTVQPNTTWSDGLHQFIEIKHNKKIRPESLVSNYLSNVGFFCRYSRIYGLTGTLGTERHRQLLEEIYNVDSVIIPPFKSKQHKELAAIVVNQRDQWYEKIIESTVSKISNRRAVLIIMKYIEEADKLAEKFRSKNPALNIKLYRTENDSEAIQQNLHPGEIIIATNLAGRGTDIKPSPEMDENGGIHVCLTYLSENSRVRVQNCGRTSRTGNRGTSQFIILEENNNSITELCSIYAMEEKANLEKAELEMKKVKTKDEIFQKFCELLHRIDLSNESEKRQAVDKEKTESEMTKPKFKHAILQKFNGFLHSHEPPDENRERQAIEERFAIWLKMHEHIIEKGYLETYNIQFEAFEKAVTSDEQKIKNPYLFVLVGNSKLVKNKSLNSKVSKLQDAVQQYTHAIELDKHTIECAYYNRAVACLLISSEEKNFDNIDEAIDDFEEARRIMESKRNYFELLLGLSEKETDLQGQCLRKIKLYSIYINSIDLAIGYDEDTLNKKIENLQVMLDPANQTNKREPEQSRRIETEIERLKEKKEMIGAIQKVRDNKTELQIESLKPCEYLEDDYVDEYTEEIEEFENNGWIQPVRISEKKKPQWWEFVAVCALGVAQILAGVATVLFTGGFAASLGDALFFEGIGDCYKAVRDCLINKNFSWSKFAKEKVITFAISIALSTAKYVIFAARAARVTFSSGIGDIMKFLANKLGLSTATSATLNFASDHVAQKTLASRITSTIIESIRPLINEKMINHPLIVKMLSIDSTRNNDDWKKQLLQYSSEVLKSMSNSDFRALKAALLSNSANVDLEEIAESTKTTSLTDEISNFSEKFLVKLFVVVDENEYQVNRIMSTLENLVPIDENSSKSLVDQTTKAVATKIMNVLQMNNSSVTSIDAGSEIYDIGQNSLPKRIISRRNRVYQKKSELKENIDELSMESDDWYSDCELNTSQNREVSENVKKIHELQKDIIEKKPLNINALAIVSDCLNRPIVVLDETERFKYKLGEASTKRPIEVQFCKSDDHSIQYFKKPGSNDAPTSLEAVICQQINKNENELRNLIVNHLEKNTEEISCKINDVVRLEMYDKMQEFQSAIRHCENVFKNVNLIVNDHRSLNHFCMKNSMELCNFLPFHNDAVDRLTNLSTKIKKTIEIYDNDGSLQYIIPQRKNHGDVLKLKYTDETFSQLNDTNSLDLTSDLNTLSTYAKPGAYTYATDLAKMTSGFLSDYQEKQILVQALSAVPDENFNEFIANSDNVSMRDFSIATEVLKLSDDERYMAFWKEGEIKCTWPFDAVNLNLKAEGRGRNDKVNVHVQNFTIPPLLNYVLFL